MSTHYEALGIPRDATAERIKRAYRSLVKVWHPDKFRSGSEAEAEAGRRIREINAAYSMLSNQSARASYDAKLERQHRRHSEPEPEHCSRCRKPTSYWETVSGKRVRLCYACGGGQQ
jgi:curved DNA-binding protein CbpA